MLKKSTPPYITTLILVIIVNILSSSYLLPLFLAGVVFKIFAISLRDSYNYLLILSVVSFLIIETTQGLRLFSLTIIALIVNFLIVPKIKHLFSSSMMSGFIYIFSFYTLFYSSVQISNSFDLAMFSLFIVNFFIDILIVGFAL